MLNLIKPDYVVPVHGEARHMREQAKVGKAAGIPAQVFQMNGDIVRLAPGKPGKIGETRTGRLVLDGDIIAPADGDAIVERRRLAANGHVIVVLPAPGAKAAPTIQPLGLPLDEDEAEFLAEAGADVTKAIRALKGSRAKDREAVNEAARLAARRAARRWSGKNPQVTVIDLAD